MTIINNPADLASAPASDEHLAFLNGLLNDYTIFDDAEYPDGYDQTLVDGDDGYVEPVIRSEWNTGAAAAWGFADQAAVEAAIEAALNPPTPEPEPEFELEAAEDTLAGDELEPEEELPIDPDAEVLEAPVVEEEVV